MSRLSQPESSAHSALTSRADRRAFVLRKLFSLSGVVPVGVFLVLHLWTYSSALSGRHAFEKAALSDSPYLFVFEVFLVWIPILFHGLYGLKISFEARPNAGKYPYSKNWMYVLQRVTGIVALVFIGYHFWQFRLPVLTGELAREDLFGQLCGSLSRTVGGGIPVMALAYLVGVAASVFHLANGLHGLCFSWGITTSRRALRIASAVFGVFGLLLFVLGANTVIYFAPGSRLVLSTNRPGPSDLPAVTCQASLGR